MAKLNIPMRYQVGVALIRQLDDQSVKEIRIALDKILDSDTLHGDIESGRRLVELATAAVSTVSHNANLKFDQIAEALVVLYGAKSVREISVDEFVDNVCDAMEAFDSSELRLPTSEREQFKKKLIVLLDADVFGIATKIVDLRKDDERVFCQARILTDLRPVFGPSIEEGPKAMVVVHLMKLEFHSASEKHQEFFVSLDSDDLQVLRGLIERAEAKAKTLKASIGSVPIFGDAKE